MVTKKYEVIVDGQIIGKELELDIALLLIKAYCQEYFREQVTITLREMDNRDRGKE